MSQIGIPISALLGRMGHEQERSPRIGPDVQIEELKQRFKLFQQNSKFAPGDIVNYKPGLDTRNDDMRDQPMLVMEVLQGPPDDAGYPVTTRKYGSIAAKENVLLMQIMHGLPFITFEDSRFLCLWAGNNYDAQGNLVAART
jgi:hypothetical protein